MTLRRDPIRVRLRRTVRDTVIKLGRVARAALRRLERERVSYAVGPFGTSERAPDRRFSRT
jgi:hypothetical protein